MEQHLDSLNLIKEKLSLNFNEDKTTQAKKRKNDNSIITTTSSKQTHNEVDVKLNEPIISKNKNKNKKKKNKKNLKVNQVIIAKPTFNLPLIKQDDSSLIIKEKLKLELEQEQLEKQLMEQQKLQQIQIEQLQKQIDEFEAESDTKLTVLESVLNQNDLSQVLNNLSETSVNNKE